MPFTLRDTKQLVKLLNAILADGKGRAPLVAAPIFHSLVCSGRVGMLRDTPLLPQSEGQTNWPAPANGQKLATGMRSYRWGRMDRINLALFLRVGLRQSLILSMMDGAWATHFSQHFWPQYVCGRRRS